MNRFLFVLFFIPLVSCASIITQIPSAMLTGETYNITHTICANDAHTADIIYEINNIGFVGKEINISGCINDGKTYNCNVNLTKGTQTIQQELNISDYAMPETFDFKIILNTTDQEFGVCKTEYTTTQTTTASSGSGGVQTNHKPTTIKPTTKNDSEKSAETETTTTEIIQPEKNNSENNIETDINNETLNSNKNETENVIPTVKKDNEHFELPENFFVFVVAVVMLVAFAFVSTAFLLKNCQKNNDLPSEKMKKIIEENEGKTEI